MRMILELVTYILKGDAAFIPAFIPDISAEHKIRNNMTNNFIS